MIDNWIAELVHLGSRPNGLEHGKLTAGISCRSLRNDKL